MKQYLEIARVINTHGIHGDMKLELWCDGPQTIKHINTLYFDENGTHSIQVKEARMHGKFLLLRAKGIDTPEEAAKYKEHILYANRDDIPLKDGDFFIADLIGTPVIDADTGITYGVLSDVIDNPANDLYAVETKQGTVYLPAVKPFIIRLDPPTGIYVRPIPGMFTEAVWNDEKANTPSEGAE